jgi:Holliday junction resolvase-like predicted endonuclease
LERNYLRRPWGEIYIVAKKTKRLYSVEVKTVSREASSQEQGSVTREPTGYRPKGNVHPTKLKRLHWAVHTYLLDHTLRENVD